MTSSRATAALLDKPWVDGVAVDGGGQSARLRITVTDVGAAEARLQRVLLEDETLVVKEFSRPSASLEDVFVDLVEDGPTDASTALPVWMPATTTGGGRACRP